MGDLIYMCGSGGEDDLQVVQSYSPKNKTWKAMPTLIQERRGHGMTSISSKIYVIGGSDEDDVCLASCEKYNPETNTWNLVAPMLTPRKLHGVAVLSGKIYACGGKTANNRSTNAVEAYDPVKNVWSRLSPMNERRYKLSVVACNNKIFAVGGASRSTQDNFTTKIALSSVEVYSPETNSWSFVQSMQIPACEMCCGVF